MAPEFTRRRVLATGAAVAGTAAVLAPLTSASAATGRPEGKAKVKPTIVLVHGGFADGSCWYGVIERLQHLAASSRQRHAACPSPFPAAAPAPTCIWRPIGSGRCSRRTCRSRPPG